jgi:hypothetical protein
MKKCGLWMITVLVILWYGNGNHPDSFIKYKCLVINDPIGIYLKLKDFDIKANG